MDLRQLQAFLAVIEHGGFTAAAKATHTVQSNISTHVARLERELDATLIDRATGNPTQEGEAVVTRVRRVQSELASLEADVSALRGSLRGTVRIGLIGTTARWFTPILVDEITKAAPEIRLVVADGTTTSLTTRVLDGELDVGIVGLPVDEPEITSSALFTEDHVLVGPKEHALANLGRKVELEDLAQHKLLLPIEASAFRKEIEQTFAEKNLRLKPQLEIDGLRLLATLAFQGYGVAIVPATAAPGWVGGPWTTIDVSGLARRTVGMVTRRRGMPSVAAQRTIEIIRAIVASQAPNVSGLYNMVA